MGRDDNPQSPYAFQRTGLGKDDMLKAMAVILSRIFLESCLDGVQDNINSHIPGSMDTDLLAGLMKELNHGV
jgi:hypothetical protein